MNTKNWFNFKLERENIILYLIILLGFLLRTARIGNQSLWNDEVTTYLQTSSNSIKDVYLTVFSEEGHIGPLYHILNHLFTNIFGYKEWALRFPSALYSTCSIFFVFLIAKRLFNVRIALFSSFLYSITPIQIYYAQEARMYSLWVLLMLIWFYQFLVFLKKPDIKNVTFLTIFAILNLWAYLNSVFLFLAAGIFLLLKWRINLKANILFLISIIVGLCFYIPGMIYFFANNTESIIYKIGSERSVNFYDFIYAFHTFNTGFSIGPSLEEIRAFVLGFTGTHKIYSLLVAYGTVLIPINLFFGILFICVSIHFLKSGKSNLLLFTLLIPFSVVVLITAILDLVPFNIRYILNLQPFYIIILSAGIFSVAGMQSKLSYGIVIVIAIVSFISLGNYYLNKKYAKPDFRSVVQFIDKNMNEGDKAIIIHEYSDVWLRYYDPTNELVKYYIPLDSSGINVARKIISTTNNKLFFIKSSRTQKYSKATLLEIDELLKDKYTESLKIKDFANLEVVLYGKQTEL